MITKILKNQLTFFICIFISLFVILSYSHKHKTYDKIDLYIEVEEVNIKQEVNELDIEKIAEELERKEELRLKELESQRLQLNEKINELIHKDSTLKNIIKTNENQKILIEKESGIFEEIEETNKIDVIPDKLNDADLSNDIKNKMIMNYMSYELTLEMAKQQLEINRSLIDATAMELNQLIEQPEKESNNLIEDSSERKSLSDISNSIKQSYDIFEIIFFSFSIALSVFILSCLNMLNVFKTFGAMSDRHPFENSKKLKIKKQKFLDKILNRNKLERNKINAEIKSVLHENINYQKESKTVKNKKQIKIENN